MKGRNDYKNDHVSKFCGLLVDACIFAPHIVTKLLSTIYMENKKLKEDADSNIRDLHNFNAENFPFKLISSYKSYFTRTHAPLLCSR